MRLNIQDSLAKLVLSQAQSSFGTREAGSAGVPSLGPMDAANRALCYFYRNPPKESGAKPLPFSQIRLRVRKANGTLPSVEACRKCARDFHQAKGKRGRKVGWRKTTETEDKVILKTFHKVRSAENQLQSELGWGPGLGLPIPGPGPARVGVAFLRAGAPRWGRSGVARRWGCFA